MRRRPAGRTRGCLLRSTPETSRRLRSQIRESPDSPGRFTVRMVAEIRGQHDSEWAAISEVARLLGVGCAETVRKWVRQAQV
ncbi:hypothetical protein ACNJNT_21175, partial [Mycobacterium tuberculosis]